MFWFNKKDPRALFIDNRTLRPVRLSNGATFKVEPDKIADFRDMPFSDETFSLVVFDPPHVRNAGEKSMLATKYGYLNKETWRDDIRRGFAECFRVLKQNGVLCFKWNECHIPLREILALTPELPLFGNRGGKVLKTHWVVFIKT